MTTSGRSDVFALAILADLGGDEGRTGPRFVPVDRDRFETAMERFAVRLAFSVPNVLVPGAADLTVSLAPRSLDDFTPDAIVRAVPELAAALAARAEVPGVAVPSAPPRPVSAPAERPGAVGSLLDRVLAESAAPSSSGALAEFVRAIAEPAVDRTDREGLAAWQATVDRRLSRQVRAILRHPRFQAVEAAWRGVRAIVEASESGPELDIRVLDLPRSAARAAASEDGLLARLIGEQADAPGATPFAAVVTDYAFGADSADMETVVLLGHFASRVRAPVLAMAAPSLVGIEDFRELGDPGVRGRLGSPALRALRADRVARWIGLSLPRILLRAPYGTDGDTPASFAFEESVTVSEHDAFLWGSSALALARILVRGYAGDGWEFDASRGAKLTGLPVHVDRADGESTMLPCAEVAMSEATITRVVEEGCIALSWIRDSDEAMFYGVQTLARSALRVRAPA